MPGLQPLKSSKHKNFFLRASSFPRNHICSNKKLIRFTAQLLHYCSSDGFCNGLEPSFKVQWAALGRASAKSRVLRNRKRKIRRWFAGHSVLWWRQYKDLGKEFANNFPSSLYLFTSFYSKLQLASAKWYLCFFSSSFLFLVFFKHLWADLTSLCTDPPSIFLVTLTFTFHWLLCRVASQKIIGKNTLGVYRLESMPYFLRSQLVNRWFWVQTCENKLFGCQSLVFLFTISPKRHQ